MIALVIIAPAILDGERGGTVTSYRSAPDMINGATRTHTIHLDRDSEKPPVARRRNDADDASPSVAAKPVAKPAPVKVATVAPKPAAAQTASQKTVKQAPAGWSVQLGSFARRDNADKLAGEVGGRGFQTYVLPLNQSARTLYRVRVGPEDSRAGADKLVGRLKKAGFKGQLMSP
jgi:cell division septation protein DedD